MRFYPLAAMLVLPALCFGLQQNGDENAPADVEPAKGISSVSVVDLRAAVGPVAQRLREGETGVTRKDLEKLVRAEFDARQNTHEAEVRLLKTKLQELEARVLTFRKSKEPMIRKRVEDLLKDPKLAEVSSQQWGAKPAPGPYKVQAGDTLGIFIPHVLGKEGDPPVFTDPTGGNPPVMGYPVQVRGNGTINVPLIADQKVVGLTINGVEARLKHVYVEEDVLREEMAKVMVSLMRKAGSTDPLVAAAQQSRQAEPTTSRREKTESAPVQSDIALKSPSEFAAELVELSKLAGSVDEGTRQNAELRFKALKQDHAVQMAMADRALSVAEAALRRAKDKARATKKLFERGFTDAEGIRDTDFAVQLASQDLQVRTLVRQTLRTALPDELPVTKPAVAVASSATMGQPDAAIQATQILKTPSEFADGFVELGELAKSGKGRVRENAITRLKALQAECELQISLLESAINAAASDYETKSLLSKAASRRKDMGTGTGTEAAKAKAAADIAKQRVRQIQALTHAYYKVMPETAQPKESKQ